MSVDTSEWDKEVSQWLIALPPILDAEARKAIKTELVKITKTAKLNHRYKTRSGRLERNTVLRSGRQMWRVGAYTPYAKYVHNGTNAHLIRAKQRKALRWSNNGGFSYAKSVIHPGTRPDRFLFNAWEKRKLNFDKALTAAIIKALRK